MRARPLLTAVSAVLALGAAGCALSAPPPPAPRAELGNIDPCRILGDAELDELGTGPPGGYPDTKFSSEPGCDFDGKPFLYSFHKNQEKTVAVYGAQDTWSKFDRRELQGRNAAVFISKLGAGGRVCSTMFDAGGGVIIVTANEFEDEGRDECGESWRVAELIAPRMPR